MDVDFSVERISRGQFGFSGFINIMEDLYDDTKVSGFIERSKFKSGPFMKMPMSLENLSLTETMNTFYKDIAMPSLQNCSINAPYFEDEFVAPLTIRKILMDKCNFMTDNLPSVMMEGYYRLTFNLHKDQMKAYVISLVLVEESK